jgi:ABC-type phosphate transport system auxiliary subunit
MNNIASWIWVLIPLAAIGIAPFRMWIRVKERQLDLQSQMTAEKTAQYAAHTERLEQRMRVLERIITDKGIEVSDEIESLRDKSLNS